MNETQKPFAPTFFLWLGLLIAAGLAVLILPHAHYYLLSPSQRPLHAAHDFLRPSGHGGLSFGAIGTILIFLNLTYLFRKELINVAWLGSLRSWMAFHVFTGLIGGAFVLLHSSFLPRSALGTLAFTSMVIVLVTGLMGRYIYSHVPRSLEGRELELDEVRRRLEGYRAGLEKLGMPQDFFKAALEPTGALAIDRGLFASIVGLVAGDRELRRAYNDLRRMVQQSPMLRPLAREIIPLALRYSQERQWLARYQELRAMMGSWRFFHRWFAILLLSAVAFHIYIASKLGNLWLIDLLFHHHG